MLSKDKMPDIFRSILFSFFCCNLLTAQSIPVPRIEFSPKKYISYFTNDTIIIDGALNESSWSKAEWTDDFVDIEGSLKPLPRFRTRAKMLWDEKYFYIAAEVLEPDIWGTLKNRDDIIFYDNDFEVFIDPDGDTKDYSEFEMNALNAVWDLLLEMPYRDVDKAPKWGWDIKGLKTGVAIYGTINSPGDNDSCWTVEIAFPWEAYKQLSASSCPPNDGDQWRLNFSRVEWKTEVKNGKYQKQINPETDKPFPEDNWVWSPHGVVDMHYPELWGYVQFSKEIAGGAQVSFIEKNEEKAKWFLRQIYYSERKYFDANKKFTSDLKKLGIAMKPIPGYVLPPVVECTASLFEASLRSADGTHTIYIRSDGLIWITSKKN